MSDAWPVVRLGDLLRLDVDKEPVEVGRVYPMVGVLSFGRGLFIKEDVDGGGTSYRVFYRLAADHIVMSQLFGWEGALAVSGPRFAGRFVSPMFPTFRADLNRLDQGFLRWWLKRPAVWQSLGSKASGMGDRRRTLNPAALLSEDIALPPMAEQQRIVARLDELAARVEEATRLRSQTVEEAMLLRYAGMKTIRQRLLLSGFPTAALGDVTRITSGGTPSRENPSYWEGSIPWVKTGELLDDDIVDTDEHITAAGVENSSAKMFPPETILIALYGQGQTRGRTGRLMIPATTNQACAAILPNPSALESRFVQYWLRSLYIDMRLDSYGGAQPNWSGAMIKMIEIALPPLPIQRTVVAQLDVLIKKVDGLKASQESTATALSALLPAILDRAFAGAL